MDEALNGERPHHALASFGGAPAVQNAHPTTKHYAPLFVTLGALHVPRPVTTITGYWFG